MKWFKSKTVVAQEPSVADGIVLGRDLNGRHLMQPLPQHVLAIAPTRSSQQEGVMVSNLLNWSQSVVVTDIRGELYRNTSHWRSTFGGVGYFNPLSCASLRWNPLHEIQHDPLRGAMIIASSLLASLDESLLFYVQGAQKILEATILYVFHEQGTLERVTDLVCATKEWARILRDLNKDHIDPLIEEVILRHVALIEGQSDVIQTGWFEVAQQALYLWSDPRICQQTSSSDFGLCDLKGEDIFSLYMVIEPGELAYLSPLVRLFFDQLSWSLHHEASVDDRHLLVICDEMPAFGPMHLVEHGLAYLGEYHVQLLMRCHDLGQGVDALLDDQCSTKLVYRCNDEETAQHLERDGMTAQELITLPEDCVVILQNEHVPICARQIFYHQDDDLLSKMTLVDLPTSRSICAVEPVPEEILNGLITQDQKGA